MKTYIYVDRTAIERNKTDKRNRPPFIVVCDGKELSANYVKIIGECELIYNPLTSPIPGITVWLETSSHIETDNPKIGEITNASRK